MNHKLSAQSNPTSFHQRNNNVIFFELLSFFFSTHDVKLSIFLEIRPIMEGRAHPSSKASLTRQVSRLKQDLSSSRHIPHMNGIKANMTRRIIPKGCIPHVCIVGAGVSGNQLSAHH